MKPYIVVKVDSGLLFDMVPPREAGDRARAVLAYASALPASPAPQHFTGEHPVYFADSESDGDVLAAYLATKTPGSHWVVAKSANSFRCQPGPVAKATFTDRGMLPAA